MRTVAIQRLLLRTSRRLVHHKNNRGESMIHKLQRLGAGV